MGLVAVNAAALTDMSRIGPVGAKHSFSTTGLNDHTDRAEVATIHTAMPDTDESSEEGRRLRPSVALQVHAFQDSKPSRDTDQRNGRLGMFLPERPPRA